MKAPAHYIALRKAALPLIQGYHADLLKHDRRVIRRSPTTPFLHLTRDYGTYITMLIPAEDFPPCGTEVPYLFGHADRWHILKEIGTTMEYGEKHHPNAMLHYFDGKTLRRVTYPQIREIVRLYQARIRAAFLNFSLVAA